MISTIYGCISANDESVQTPKAYERGINQEQLVRRVDEMRRNDAIHETLRFIEKYAERLEGELGRYQILSGNSTDEMRHNTFAIQKFSVDEQYKLTHDGKELREKQTGCADCEGSMPGPYNGDFLEDDRGGRR